MSAVTKPSFARLIARYVFLVILIMMMMIMVMIVISCFYRRITTTTQFPPSSARIKMEDLDVDLFKLLVTVGFVFLTWVGQILRNVSAMRYVDFTS